MEPDTILAWIDDRKRALGIKSDAKVEKLAKRPDAIRNLRRGRSMPKIQTLRALETVLGNPPEGLFDQPVAAGSMPSIEELEAELAYHQDCTEKLKITLAVLRGRKRAG